MKVESVDGFISNENYKPHNLAQLRFMYNQFESVIDMLDVKSLNEIGGGYKSDVDRLMDVIEEETIKIFDSVPEPINPDKFYNLENTKALEVIVGLSNNRRHPKLM